MASIFNTTEMQLRILLVLNAIPKSKMDSRYSMLCWSCGQYIATCFHMWWKCDSVLKFWRMILKEITETLWVKVETCTQITFLPIFDHDQWGSIKEKKNYNVVMATRLITARNWKVKYIVQISEWYIKKSMAFSYHQQTRMSN